MRARILVLALALLGGAGTLHAQQQLVAAAVVPIASPTGAGTRNLTFGSIIPGTAAVNVTVPAAPAAGATQAGEYRFGVGNSRGLTFSMTTPAQLTSATTTPLNVSFNGAQYGAYCITVNGSACTTTTFNPVSATVNVCAQTLGNGSCHPNRTFAAGSQLAVYVGGLLTVPPGAMPATYTATVTLTITQVY